MVNLFTNFVFVSENEYELVGSLAVGKHVHLYMIDILQRLKKRHFLSVWMAQPVTA